MKERVCQLFEVCQHEFANLSLPCQGRLNDKQKGPRSTQVKIVISSDPVSLYVC